MSDEIKNPTEKKPYRAVRTRTAGRGIADRVREIIQPTADELGYYLWDVEYVKEGADFILRVTIDRFDETGEGITIDDCEAVSRELSDLLDVEDFIPEAYFLEISSPGLGRPFKKDRDYERNIGEEVELKLYKQINHIKDYVGLLKDFSKETVTIELENGETMEIDRQNIAIIRQTIYF